MADFVSDDAQRLERTEAAERRIDPGEERVVDDQLLQTIDHIRSHVISQPAR